LRRLAASRLSLAASGLTDGAGKHCRGDGIAVSLLEYLASFTPERVRQKIRDGLRTAGLTGQLPAVEFVPHHLSHAWQAFWQSPFEEAAVLVADGSGEENCVSGYAVRQGTFKKILGYDIPYSLGWLYGGFTAYLGFEPNRNEGKFMGLAALGECRRLNNPWPERLDRILRVVPGGYEMDPTFFKLGDHNLHPGFTDKLARFITGFEPDLSPVGIAPGGGPEQRYLKPGCVDLAWAVQDRLEQALVELSRRLLAESRLQNLCLSGGVFMNCKANGELLKHSGAKRLFVHPASSDDGSCIGAALHVAAANGDMPRNTLDHVQLGPAFTDGEIRRTLESCGVAYSRPPDICRSAAELIAGQRVVGWFRGGAEMGARALGGRSIVAAPQVPAMKDRINRQVKFRESWRPYCPSLTAESAIGLLAGREAFPYMIVAQKAGLELEERAPAVVHVDSTVRPQTVDRRSLPDWHRLIECVGELTGLPVVLNTSLNVRGEPMACTPRDALACLFTTGLDALAIGDCLVIKGGLGK
jgi:carbamoyltransferase